MLIVQDIIRLDISVDDMSFADSFISKDFIVTPAPVTQVFDDVRIIRDGYDFDSSYCICFGVDSFVYMTGSTVAETVCNDPAGLDFWDVDVHTNASYTIDDKHVI